MGACSRGGSTFCKCAWSTLARNAEVEIPRTAVAAERLSETTHFTEVQPDSSATSVSPNQQGQTSSSSSVESNFATKGSKQTTSSFGTSAVTSSFSSGGEFDPFKVVVIDNGSGFCKIGFAGNEKPTASFPCLVGRPRHQEVMHDANRKDYYVGDEAQRYRGVLSLKYPIDHGIVTDWDDMERVWRYGLTHELRLPEDLYYDKGGVGMMLTEAPLNPKSNRERMCSLMFESIGVSSLYVAVQAVLSLYASGRTTAVVLDSGDGVTHVVPVYEGFAITHAISRLDIAGRDVTAHLRTLLRGQGHSFVTTAEFEIIRDIKERLCFVSPSALAESNDSRAESSKQQTYQLPDGRVISIDEYELQRAPECMFRPALIGKGDSQGVHEMLFKCISNKCDVDVRRDLFKNVILSGGNTCFNGMSERLHRELTMLAPDGIRVGIVDPPDRKYSVWTGGSILASLPTFREMWISKYDYDETGPNIIHRKCF